MLIVARFKQSFLSEHTPSPLSQQTLEWRGSVQGEPQAVRTGCWYELAEEIEQQPRPDTVKLLLLLPAEYAQVRRIDLPKMSRRQARQAIPFILEESIAGEIDQQHIAWSIQHAERKATCSIIKKEWMVSIRELIGATTSYEVVLVPESLIVFHQERHSLTVLSDQRAILCNGQEAFAIQYSALTDQLHAEDISEIRIIDNLEFNDGLDEIDQYSDATHEAVHTTRVPSYFDLLDIQDLPALEKLNLLTGPYTIAKQSTKGDRFLKYSVGLFLLTWVLHLVSDAALAWHFHQKEIDAAQQAKGLFSQYFPSKPYPRSLARYLQSVKSPSQTASSESHFIESYSLLLSSLKTGNLLNTVTPIGIRYEKEKNTLSATLSVPDVSFSDTVIKAIRDNNGKASLISANNSEDGATIRIAMTQEGS